MRVATTVLLCLLTVALAAGCDDGDSPAGGAAPAAAPPAPAVESEGIAVSVDVAKAAVALGDPITLRLVVVNTGSSPQRVSIPRIDRHCATVRVRVGSAAPYVVEHLFGEITAAGLEWTAPNAQELPPGGELTSDIELTAVQTGEHHLTVAYRRTMNSDPLTLEPVKVVVSADGEKSILGARFETSAGPVTVRLRPDVAPVTVNSFSSLVRAGFFDGLNFHRIVAGFMAQGGDPKGDGSGGCGYYLPLEAKKDLLHRRGVLSMARTAIKDTAGSQFFLMFATRPDLDPGFRGGDGYTTFGEMVDGEATLAKLEAMETRIAPAVQRQIDAQGIPAAQVAELVRLGRIEKSSPVERVGITSVKLVTLE